MGAAARRYAESSEAAASRPHLRLATANPRRAKARSRRSQAGLASAVFRVFCAAMVVVAVVGLARIALAVQATEAAIEAVKIQQDIRVEELQSKSLEADASALNAPSRVAAIADSALNMTEAGQVAYLAAPASDAIAATASSPKPHAASDGLGAIVASVMDIAAGEAQVMLVGDVGLSAR
ncbi:MAG: hypothetical protein Q8S43_07940 [Actinomycetota bacterium]|nr:MAG: hypothetical protein FD171_828 [Actinomycetota bacterium]MDO8949657.1 hypothetical protein [Actinomycetota bacterium]MDP3630865.1 hypothetical protein [Actinomycetota bacterium]